MRCLIEVRAGVFPDFSIKTLLSDQSLQVPIFMGSHGIVQLKLDVHRYKPVYSFHITVNSGKVPQNELRSDL